MERSKRFARNEKLETLLQEVNDSLWQGEKLLLGCKKSPYPIIFIMGALRSGTTMLMQWLANTGQIAYPSNLLSRFYNAPILGAKLQLLLSDKQYQFRDELAGIVPSVGYYSENGKTKGFLSPNEFWYFWRRFSPFDSRDYASNEDLRELMDSDLFRSELAGVSKVFDKPFALKGMIANYNIEFINEIIGNAIFICIERDIVANVQSVINARIKQYGTADEWYSFKIKEYPQLKNLDYIEQITSQIFFINKAIQKGISHLPDSKVLQIKYEDFCDNPEYYYKQLSDKLSDYSFDMGGTYSGKTRFEHTNQISLSKKEISRIHQTIASLHNLDQ